MGYGLSNFGRHFSSIISKAKTVVLPTDIVVKDNELDVIVIAMLVLDWILSADETQVVKIHCTAHLLPFNYKL